MKTKQRVLKTNSDGSYIVAPTNKGESSAPDAKGQRYYQAKRRKRKQPLMYFTKETQDAIVEYNNETDPVRKNIIYNKHIYPALDKMVEITIHANKLYHFDTTFEDMKAETVTFLTRQMGKFDPSTGALAFSYFSVIAKRYLIVENKKNFGRTVKNVGLEYANQDDDMLMSHLRSQHNDELKDFVDSMVEFLDRNLTALFPKQRDMMIADSIIDIFRNRHNIENYNKKSIFILIRERTNVKTQYITGVLKEMFEIYKRLYDVYSKYGTLDDKVISDELMSAQNGNDTRHQILD